MAQYLLVDDANIIAFSIEAKSIPEAIDYALTGIDTDGLSFDVYRVAGAPKRVTIEHEMVRRVVVK